MTQVVGEASPVKVVLSNKYSEIVLLENHSFYL